MRNITRGMNGKGAKGPPETYHVEEEQPRYIHIDTGGSGRLRPLITAGGVAEHLKAMEVSQRECRGWPQGKGSAGLIRETSCRACGADGEGFNFRGSK